MDEHQLETLLRQMPAAKAPAGMKESIMDHILVRQQVQSFQATSRWPEKSLLVLSLLAGFISLLWVIDFGFLTEWLTTGPARINTLFTQNMLNLNKAAIFAGELPVYVLSVTFVIAGLLLLERLVLRRLFTNFSLL